MRARKTLKASNRLRASQAAGSDAAARLWAVLKEREIAGLRFQESERVGPYVVDFICPAARVVVLLEGPEARDPEQIVWLRSSGYRVLVFPEGDVLANPQIVVDAMARGFELRIVKS